MHPSRLRGRSGRASSTIYGRVACSCWPIANRGEQCRDYLSSRNSIVLLEGMACIHSLSKGYIGVYNSSPCPVTGSQQHRLGSSTKGTLSLICGLSSGPRADASSAFSNPSPGLCRGRQRHIPVVGCRRCWAVGAFCDGSVPYNLVRQGRKDKMRGDV